MTVSVELEKIKQGIEAREARIGIVGMGYVGLPLALLFSEERFAITGFDIDARKVDTLNGGGSYIVRILGSEIQSAQKHGFQATSDYSRIQQMDVVIICVPTPLDEHHEPDLSYITGTVKAMAPYLRQGQLVILESTTYPGTTEEVVVPLLEAGKSRRTQGGARCGERWHSMSPFRRSGKIRATTRVARRDIPKVVGGCGAVARDLAAAVYGTIFNRTVPVSIAGRGGDGQAARKHLSLRQHRAGQRAEAALHAHGHGHLGGHRGGQDQALWLPCLLSGAGPGRPLHPHRSVLSFVEGQGVRLPHALH